nr:MAG TPA: Protein of unknown function (DUF669) [Caudoviricetes sp.]
MKEEIRNLMSKWNMNDTATRVSMKDVEGTFNCKIIELMKTKSQKGNDMIKIVFEVVDGEHAGGRFNHYMSWTEKTMKWTLTNLVDLAEYGYDVAAERLTEDVKEPMDLLNNAVAELQKKICKKTLTLKVERKKKGEFINDSVTWPRETKEAEDFYSTLE